MESSLKHRSSATVGNKRRREFSPRSGSSESDREDDEPRLKKKRSSEGGVLSRSKIHSSKSRTDAARSGSKKKHKYEKRKMKHRKKHSKQKHSRKRTYSSSSDSFSDSEETADSSLESESESSSVSTSSLNSAEDARISRNKSHKHKKRAKKRSKHRKRSVRKDSKGKSKPKPLVDSECIPMVVMPTTSKTTTQERISTQIHGENTEARSAKQRGPMTREEWEKLQSVLRRVYDPDTGRHRLVRGEGEIVEEIVSREQQKNINKQATVGDSMSFQLGLKRLL